MRAQGTFYLNRCPEMELNPWFRKLELQNWIMPKKKPVKGKPVVHEDLKGLEIRINEFGEIISNTPVDKINKFLDKHVEDKKFKERDDLELGEDVDLDKFEEEMEMDEETQERLKEFDDEEE